jgi:23S rRNA C2498 (ribose-2'-O)-methylase RlmM
MRDHFSYLFLTYRPGFEFQMCHERQATAISLSLFSHLSKRDDNAGQVVFIVNQPHTDTSIASPLLTGLEE